MAFLKFLAIYSENFPKLVSAVIKHDNIVRELARRRTGMSWYVNDKQIRKDIEARAIPLRKLHYEYWELATLSKLSATLQNFRSKSQFQNKGGGGHTSAKYFQGGSVLHLTDQVDAHQRSINLNTVAINVESHTQSSELESGAAPR